MTRRPDAPLGGSDSPCESWLGGASAMSVVDAAAATRAAAGAPGRPDSPSGLVVAPSAVPGKALSEAAFGRQGPQRVSRREKKLIHGR
jgi:hypothetical protein